MRRSWLERPREEFGHSLKLVDVVGRRVAGKAEELEATSTYLGSGAEVRLCLVGHPDLDGLAVGTGEGTLGAAELLLQRAVREEKWHTISLMIAGSHDADPSDENADGDALRNAQGEESVVLDS